MLPKILLAAGIGISAIFSGSPIHQNITNPPVETPAYVVNETNEYIVDKATDTLIENKIEELESAYNWDVLTKEEASAAVAEMEVKLEAYLVEQGIVVKDVSAFFKDAQFGEFDGQFGNQDNDNLDDDQAED